MVQNVSQKHLVFALVDVLAKNIVVLIPDVLESRLAEGLRRGDSEAARNFDEGFVRADIFSGHHARILGVALAKHDGVLEFGAPDALFFAPLEKFLESVSGGLGCFLLEPLVVEVAGFLGDADFLD